MAIVGTLSAFVFSYISIAWLLRYLQTRNTSVLVWYRLAFGVAMARCLPEQLVSMLGRRKILNVC